MLQLITKTFENAGQDLLKFPVELAALGLKYITGEGSGLLYCIYDDDISLQYRLSAIRNMIPLYRDFFAQRCDNTMSDDTQNPLNGYCYMLWDAGCLYLGGFKEKDKDAKEMVDAVLYVLTEALKIPHLACQESALHGLGHSLLDCEELERRFQKPYSKYITDAIDDFLTDQSHDEKMRKYAFHARKNQIN